MESLIQSISDKQDQAAGLCKELKNSLYIRSLFPDVIFPCNKLVTTMSIGTRERLDYVAVGCHIEDAKGMKHYLTADQYSGIKGNKFTASVREWRVDNGQG
jgi:hypothetical protein